MLEIEALRQQRAGAAYQSPARICLTAAGELVDCSDPAAATLLVGEGGEIPWEVAERYGLVASGGEEPPGGKRAARGKRVPDAQVEDKGA
jgi:hypothetical protein